MSTDVTDRRLPSFNKPPVIEVVLGVQFEPLASVTSAHLGSFASGLGNDWRIKAEAARLSEATESFGPKPSLRLPRFGIRLQPQPSVNRVQITHQSDDRMIQVQDTHFVYNWIKKTSAYPRYRVVRTEFDSQLAGFRQFVASNELGAMRENQWEVTYVNHIPSGELWTEPSEWDEVCPGLLPRIRPYGGTIFENMNGEWRSEIPKERGRLHISMRQQAGGDEKSSGVLVLQLTARGPVNDAYPLGAGLDIGRETIVNVFTEITSKRAHDFWELQK